MCRRAYGPPFSDSRVPCRAVLNFAQYLLQRSADLLEQVELDPTVRSPHEEITDTS
jgi:hypothetical protein